MSDDDAPEELEDVDSGPYCEHWDDPADCDVQCATCSHACCHHDRHERSCLVFGCDCAAFTNPPEDRAT